MKKVTFYCGPACHALHILDTIQTSGTFDSEKKLIIDVGSGGTKCYVIQNTMLIKYKVVNIPYGKWLSENNNKINQLHIAIVKTRITEIEETLDIKCQKISCRGIATAWARAIENYEVIKTVFDESNISITIASQQDEGTIGYMTVKQNLPQHRINHPFIVIDCGGGSCQINFEHYLSTSISVLCIPYGAYNFKALVEQHIKTSYNQTLDNYLNEFKDRNNEFTLYAIGGLFNKCIKYFTDYIAGSRDIVLQLDKYVNMSNSFDGNISEAKQHYENSPCFSFGGIIQQQTNLILVSKILELTAGVNSSSFEFDEALLKHKALELYLDDKF